MNLEILPIPILIFKRLYDYGSVRSSISNPMSVSVNFNCEEAALEVQMFSVSICLIVCLFVVNIEFNFLGRDRER